MTATTDHHSERALLVLVAALALAAIIALTVTAYRAGAHSGPQPVVIVTTTTQPPAPPSTKVACLPTAYDKPC